MRTKVLLPLLCALVPCGGTWALAQRTDTAAKATVQQTQQSADKDLEDLASELDAADKSQKTEATKRSMTVKPSMESYKERARRQAMEMRARLMKDPRWRPTHKQVKRFDVGAQLINMCLDSQGHILTCCGDKAIRVFSQDGKLLETRSLTFAPEAIGLRPSDGAVFIAGHGNLVRMSADGTPQKEIEFPPPPSKAEQEAAVQKKLKRAEAQIKRTATIVAGIKKQLDALKKQLAKQTIGEAERKKVAAIPANKIFAYVERLAMSGSDMKVTFKKGTAPAVQARVLETYLKQLGGADIEQMRQRIRAQAERSIGIARFTGLAVGDKDLFAVCTGSGYTYNVWRMTHDFQQPKRILTGLSGCCGQLDCQTLDGNLWLAVNTRHKVCCYDRDGNKLSEFGKNDAKAADGFGGCCEPKNLRFAKDGQYIYCAQSGPPVCVRRYTLDGKFLDVVCFPIYDTGCVRVSVDVDGDTFFMMSPNENAVYVFKPADA